MVLTGTRVSSPRPCFRLTILIDEAFYRAGFAIGFRTPFPGRWVKARILLNTLMRAFIASAMIGSLAYGISEAVNFIFPPFVERLAPYTGGG